MLEHATYLALPVAGMEVDTHAGFIAFHEDRTRDRALAALGLEVQRLTGNDVTGTPTKTARDLSAALERRSAPPR